ncbi:IS30 family transposase [Hahella ganghwensis]|uniref:IS30 family transposase n=1 Tax=Hahella ganghwensis TaxID=286420 RepID=UPI000371A58C|nr:IS30 family transposase [Hahella ganghwensis]
MPSFTQLTREQRYQIYALRKQHLSQAEIARNIGVHRSTVCRELRRCQGIAAYQPEQAHQQALGFRYNAHKSFKIEGQLKSYLLFYLALDLSPEQISGILLLRHHLPLSFQSIYRYLQRDNWWGGELFKQLRKVGRRTSYLGDQRRRSKYSQPPVANRVSIRERPQVVERRKRFGDWEIDTIIGRKHKSALLSITERKSQFLCLKKLKEKNSDSVRNTTMTCLRRYQDKVKTITSDNGSEFAQHQDIAKSLKARFYFADPYSAWQRGTNENLNGLIRQYFPKKTDFRHVTDQEVQKVVNRLNHRPRKSLNYRTPAEVFLGQKPIWLDWVGVAIIG